MADVVDTLPGPDVQYHPRDAIAASIRSTLLVGGAGVLMASVQNTMSRQNVGAFGVVSRFGGTVGLFAAMGGSYAFVSTAMANLREKEDAYNQFVGGFVGGALSGLRRRTIASGLGNGLFLGIALAGVHFASGNFAGNQTLHPDEGRWPTKEEVRKRFRRPYQETINELGEGRGIYGPNYYERRAQRLKDNYDIEVPDYKPPTATS